jgi:hypothetical protein
MSIEQGTESFFANAPIKQSIQKAQLALLDAIGRPTDFDFNRFRLDVNFETAIAMGRTQEITDYMKQGPLDLERLKPGGQHENEKYGVPGRLYGVELWVSDGNGCPDDGWAKLNMTLAEKDGVTVNVVAGFKIVEVPE